MKKFKCPCCGYFTLAERSVYEICPVCFWEDDGIEDPEDGHGPNKTTLGEARQNYSDYGACEPDMLINVRKPFPEEGPRE